MTVEGALVKTADQFASNGIIHIIDRVVRPSRFSVRQILIMEHDTRFFYASARMAKVGIPKNVTVFAPKNSAFMNKVEEAEKKIFASKNCLRVCFSSTYDNFTIFPLFKAS